MILVMCYCARGRLLVCVLRARMCSGVHIIPLSLPPWLLWHQTMGRWRKQRPQTHHRRPWPYGLGRLGQQLIQVFPTDNHVQHVERHQVKLLICQNLVCCKGFSLMGLSFGLEVCNATSCLTAGWGTNQMWEEVFYANPHSSFLWVGAVRLYDSACPQWICYIAKKHMHENKINRNSCPGGSIVHLQYRASIVIHFNTLIQIIFNLLILWVERLYVMHNSLNQCLLAIIDVSCVSMNSAQMLKHIVLRSAPFWRHKGKWHHTDSPSEKAPIQVLVRSSETALFLSM